MNRSMEMAKKEELHVKIEKAKAWSTRPEVHRSVKRALEQATITAKDFKRSFHVDPQKLKEPITR
jgi:hypothetical protein